MNPALILPMVPGLVDTVIKAYLKYKEIQATLPPGAEPTPEQVRAIFAEFPALTFDDYMNAARAQVAAESQS